MATPSTSNSTAQLKRFRVEHFNYVTTARRAVQKSLSDQDLINLKRDPQGTFTSHWTDYYQKNDIETLQQMLGDNFLRDKERWATQSNRYGNDPFDKNYVAIYECYTGDTPNTVFYVNTLIGQAEERRRENEAQQPPTA